MGEDGGDTAAGQRVAQGAHQQGADHALGLGAEQVEGAGGCLGGEPAQLGFVAVGDDEVVLMGERGDRGGHPDDVGPFQGGVGVPAAVQQGVAAQGDHDAHGGVLHARAVGGRRTPARPPCVHGGAPGAGPQGSGRTCRAARPPDRSALVDAPGRADA
ncbi:hypothetical protein GCM10020256_71000 [Streptomyces thermocoprophilus]